MPSLLILDDLHLICPAPGDAPDNANAGGSAAMVEWLCDVLDSFRPPGKPVLPGTQLSLTLPSCSSPPTLLCSCCENAWTRPHGLPGNADHLGMAHGVYSLELTVLQSSMITKLTMPAQ